MSKRNCGNCLFQNDASQATKVKCGLDDEERDETDVCRHHQDLVPEEES